METSEKILVAGHRVVSTGQVCVIVKNAVSKNPLFQVRATKNGSLYLVKGITLEEAKAELPLGKTVDGFKWGKQIPADKNGTELTNVYELETV